MEKVNFRPLNGRVLVKEEVKENKTKSGIITTINDPETASGEGVIMAINYPDEAKIDGFVRDNEPKVGDRVAYHPKSGAVVNLEEGPFRQMPYTDLYGVIE